MPKPLAVVDYPPEMNAAIAAMDQLVPDWWQKVDPTKLNLMDCDNCIIGQSFETYNEGDALMHETGVYPSRAFLGSTNYDYNRSNDPYHRAWRAEITRRQQAAKESQPNGG